ncbi:MAG: PD-(D/E)XK nuclease family protein [Actinobacteria bacterium]|nr:PD-(D/E)XK nuclease family protein [Actinomycetota bacterium]
MSAVATNALIEAGIKHVSPSSLNRFLRCPENFRQRYVCKKPDRAGHKALLGTADSKAFEDFYVARLGGGPGISLSDCEDSFRDHLLAKAEADEYDLEGETTSSLIDTGIPTIRAYYPVAQSMPDPIAVEEKILIERDSLPVPILGYTDVEFEAFGIDRKGAANKSVHPDWRLQTRIYSAAKSKPWGLHVTTRTKVPAVYTPSDGEQYEESWSTAKADRTVRMVGQIVASMESMILMFGVDDPWPQNGYVHQWACPRCPYKSSCPAWA